ncbi:Ig-like domain-containing protein, partial [Candidatus Desantisbacteria bacterium]|nr:Ig-like domain-containing protein [Candidatus Desantisbacteria bacterium]
MSVVDTVAFVASFRSGLYALDITDPKKPLLINNYNTTGWAYEVCVKNGYAFVADAYSGLQIIDVSNPKNLTLAGNCSTNGWAYDIFVEGRYAYMADYRLGLQIIDVQNPGKPEVVGNCRTDSTAYGVWVSGQYAYLADGVSGLRIIDVSNPNSPRLISTYDTKGKAYDVQVVGKYAFVADGQYSGLQIIDVSDPAAPKLVGYCTTPGIASKIFVQDGYAYIADGQYSGLQIINVSDVKNPIIVTSCKTPGKAYGIFLSGKNAIMADGSNGLQIIDVPRPSEAPKGKVTIDCCIASDYLILTSPNGRECLSGNKQYEIKWTTTGAVLPYSIALSYSTDHGRTYPYSIATITSGSSYKWLVPAIDSNSLRLKVELRDGNGEYGYDESDADFSIDSTAPVVVGVSPANKIADVPVDTDMVINFSEVMNPANTEASFGINPDSGTRVYKWSNEGKTLTVDLSRLDYNTSYSCVVSTRATDMYGSNSLIQNYTWAFCTEKQVAPLQSTLLLPAAGVSLAGGNEYDIIWQITGGKPPYTIGLYYSTDGGKVYLPIAQSATGTSYRWRVPGGNFNDVKLKVVASDASGAQVNSVNQESVKIDSTPPQVVSTIPASNEINVASTIGTITVVFNEGMNSSQTQNSFSIGPGLIIKACHSIANKNPGMTTNITNLSINGYEWNADNTILRVGVKGIQPDTEYACIISNQARDIVGNTLTAAYKWNFKTSYENGLIKASLLQPDGELCLTGGSSQSIEWQVSGGASPYSTELYYTTGSGTWLPIAGSVVSPYKWTVPIVNSESGQLKIVVKDTHGACIEATSNMFGIDSIPPTVTSIIPSMNGANVDITNKISLTFSEAMNTDKTQEAFVISPNPGILGYHWSNGSTTLTVELKGTLSYNTLYTCMLNTGASEFCAENQLTGSYTWSFTTRKV